MPSTNLGSCCRENGNGCTMTKHTYMSARVSSLLDQQRSGGRPTGQVTISGICLREVSASFKVSAVPPTSFSFSPVVTA